MHPQEVYPQDENHLKLLSVFHYVMSALYVLTSFIFSIYIIMGVMMAVAPDAFDGSSNPPPPFLGWFFVGFGGIGMAILVGFGVLQIVTARSLTSYKRYIFCMIIAGFNCLNVPLGTTLGVFTFIVLLRPSVQALFQGKSQPGAPYRS